MDDSNNNRVAHEEEEPTLLPGLADDSIDATVPDTYTPEELATFIKVLRIIYKKPELVDSTPELKEFGLGKLFQSKKERKIQWVRENKQKLQRQKEKDAIKINKTEMRKNRNDALQKLLDAIPTEEVLKIDHAGKLLIKDKSDDDPLTSNINNNKSNAKDLEGVVDSFSDEDNDEAIDTSATTKLNFRRKCHICATFYKELHFFYDSLCPQCAALNYEKRNATRDLTGQVALVTGGRIKIGYQVVLKLLRAGATVIVTTRFPQDGAKRYELEPDFDSFKDRLHIYGLDLRDLASVERFCEHIKKTFDRLHIIINNAAQTVARPYSYYEHLLEGETKEPSENAKLLLDASWQESDAGVRASRVHRLNRHHYFDDYDYSGNGTNNSNNLKIEDKTNANANTKIEEEGQADNNNNNDYNNANKGQKEVIVLKTTRAKKGLSSTPTDMYDMEQASLDLRRHNTWLATLEQIPSYEAAEVHAINALAPFILNSKLKSLMMYDTRTTTTTKATDGEKEQQQRINKYIVNVSAMEGQFYRYKKPTHPHTNMAKAAMNMMTRTSASDYAKDGIYMNSIDTGWITDENPLHITLKKIHEHGFQPPLDEVDAAARILDPIMSNSTEFGKFYKNYFVTPW